MVNFNEKSLVPCPLEMLGCAESEECIATDSFNFTIPILAGDKALEK